MHAAGSGGEYRALVFCKTRNSDGGRRCWNSSWSTSHKIFLQAPRIDAASIAAAITGVQILRNGDHLNLPRSPEIICCQLCCSSWSWGIPEIVCCQLCCSSWSSGIPEIVCCQLCCSSWSSVIPEIVCCQLCCSSWSSEIYIFRRRRLCLGSLPSGECMHTVAADRLLSPPLSSLAACGHATVCPSQTPSISFSIMISSKFDSFTFTSILHLFKAVGHWWRHFVYININSNVAQKGAVKKNHIS